MTDDANDIWICKALIFTSKKKKTLHLLLPFCKTFNQDIAGMLNAFTCVDIFMCLLYWTKLVQNLSISAPNTSEHVRDGPKDPGTDIKWHKINLPALVHVSNESIAIIKFNIVHAITVLARHVIGCHGDGGWGSKILYNRYVSLQSRGSKNVKVLRKVSEYQNFSVMLKFYCKHD